ncbi:hypothetical protein Glove_92g69 [Diversispora epigaea]|uniref:Protein kinase domain-containing protein n=1 Tax=Diversispora epigaea TaxID=1348612 RepID=A0A397J578_9GLOM|nr:hypothetical protein Glove_92g69 [Diversispora epigaea]
MSSNICPECNQNSCEYRWCKSKHVHLLKSFWKCGNDKIDKLIQEAQLNANYNWELIEWISYDRNTFIYNGFTICKRWKSSRIFENYIDWKQKLRYLAELPSRLMRIHELDIVHRDFHPGNILLSNFNDFMMISDFGLSKLIRANPNNLEKKNIFGVLPYIAPEVLNEGEYTKAADVHSFGIIAYEIITGFPPYPDIPHDKDLAMKICNGLRPKIPFHIPKLITRTIMCWDARITHRPTFKELKNELCKYYKDYCHYLEEGKNNDSEIVIQIKKPKDSQQIKNQPMQQLQLLLRNYQTHLQAIYTSRLNFSKLPKPKNEENFEKELEELAISDLCPSNSDLFI